MALKDGTTRAVNVSPQYITPGIYERSLELSGVGKYEIEAIAKLGKEELGRDKAILQITLIASWFNYINRVADALGVGRE